MQRLLLSTTVIFGLAAGMAFADDLTDSIVADLQAQGYTRIEIKTGPTQLKVEAIRGTEKLEVIYDAATGAVRKREMETVDAGDDTTPGIEIDTRDDDFLRDDDRGGDDDDDHSDRSDDDDDDGDHSDGSDNDGDDGDHSDGSDNDDDGDDDHESNSGHGGGDDSDDD